VVPSLLRVFSLFGVLTPKGENIVTFIIFHCISFPQCVMDMCSRCVVVVWTRTLLCLACKTFYGYYAYCSIYLCMIML
jgi:hypothetical protein